MSTPATIQGVEPFIPADVFVLPAEIPFGLTATEFSWRPDPRGNPTVPRQVSCLYCHSHEHRSGEHRSFLRRDEKGNVIRDGGGLASVRMDPPSRAIKKRERSPDPPQFGQSPKPRPETFRKTSALERYVHLAKLGSLDAWRQPWRSYNTGGVKLPKKLNEDNFFQKYDKDSFFQRYAACGSFNTAVTSSLVANSLWWYSDNRPGQPGPDPLPARKFSENKGPGYHGLMLKQAEMLETAASSESQGEIDLNDHLIFLRVVVPAIRVKRLREGYKEYGSEEIRKPTKAQCDWATEVAGPAEPRGEKFVKRKSDDFKEKFKSEDEIVLFTGSDDEEESGPPEGHDHIIPMYEDATRKTKNPKTHEDLQAVRKFKEESKSPFPVEVFTRNKPIKEAAEELGLSQKTLQKQKERFMKDAKMMAERPSGIPFVDTPDEVYDGIRDGEAYLLLDAGNGWKHYRLDTKTHGTLTGAVQAMKEHKIRAAWRESDLRKSTKIDFIKSKEKRRTELARLAQLWEGRFAKSFVLRDPDQWPEWRGLLGSLETEKAA